MRKIYLLVTSLFVLISLITINGFCAKSNSTSIDSNIEYIPQITNVFAKTIINSNEYNNVFYSKEEFIDSLDETIFENIEFTVGETELNINLEITNYNPNQELTISWGNIYFSINTLYYTSGNGYNSLIKIRTLEYKETLSLDFTIKLLFPYKASYNFEIEYFNIYFG